MPLFTFYFLHRGVRKPIDGWSRWPSDWGELKGKLEEIALKIYNETKLTDATVMLERHLSGKFRMASKGYGRTKVRFRRGVEGYFRVSFSPLTGKVVVEQASFGGALSFLTSDFVELEKGRKYKCSPLIPKVHQNLLGNAKALVQGERSGFRFADYSRSARLTYDRVEDQLHRVQHYNVAVARGYLKGGERVGEQVRVG